MTLSIIIVNYNVKYFLQQCLQSVFDSSRSIHNNPFELEVFVVDNNSVDDSVEMVRSQFPQVRLIANNDNPGFAKANNQALRQCSGDYILLLNPDTLVEKETFAQCIEFFHEHSDCGGLSLRMVNGEGTFLKESKRGFPSPATSFYKISGLIKLFPRHPKFAAYYQGHIPDNQTQEVDILPGAFLMLSREAFNKIGLLDESYFMYGEDVDFSWRIHLAGFKNYYLPSARILHYKGECTRKGSMNYVYTFYNAMAIFSKRYFNGPGAHLFNILIRLAIWARASLAFLQRIGKHLAVPLADQLLSFGGFIAIKQLWATYWAANINYYPSIYTWAILPLYSLILLLTVFLSGGYDKPIRLGRIAKGVGIGSFLLLAFYSLLDETLRYSRAIILLGSLWTLLSTIGMRGILSLLHIPGYRLHPEQKHRYLILAGEEESARIQSLFDSLDIQPKSVKTAPALPAQQVADFDSIVFGSDIPIHNMLDTLEQLRGKHIVFRRAPAHSHVLLGSNYTHSTEELYTNDLGLITSPTNRRRKRVFDFLTALLLILSSPIHFWFQRRKRELYPHLFAVLVGRCSWVAFSLKPGIFAPRDIMPRVKNPDTARLDHNYAHDYHIATDFQILFLNLFNL